MKNLFMIFGLALSLAAHAATGDATLLQNLGKDHLARMQRSGEPFLRVEGGQPTQGSEFNLFVRPASDYANSVVVIDANLDGNAVTLEHPTKDLWIFNQSEFEALTRHTLNFTVSLENATQAGQISQALTSVEQQIQTLQTQIANTTDPNELAQLNAQLAQETALQSQLTADLTALKNPIGTQAYSFTVAPAASGATFPTITAVSPNVGATAGATSLTITGTNFVSGATVSVGGLAATGVVFNSATSLTAVTPAFPADGPKDIVVTLPLASGDVEQKQAKISNAFFATSASLGGGGGTGGLNIPVAIAGATQAVTLGSAASLNGSNSVGPTGHTLTYAWSLISKPVGSNLATGTTVATTATASVTPDYPGSFVYQLVVTDSTANVVSAASLTVVSASLASATLTASAPPITIVRSASATSQITVTDTNSTYLTFSYYISQPPLFGPASVSNTGQIYYHELSSNVNNTVDEIGVTVVDSAMHSYSFFVPITITTSTNPSFSTYGCSMVTNTLPIQLGCSTTGITTPNGSLASIQWNFGDGSPNEFAPISGSSEGNLQHNFINYGTYFVKIIVTDNLGAFVQNAMNFVVQADPVPVAKFTLSSVSGAAPFTVTANAAASSISSGTTVNDYNWFWGDGSAEQSGSTLSAPSHTFTTAGTYQVRLQLRDSKFAATNAYATVYVGTTPPTTGSPANAYVNVTSPRSQALGSTFAFDGATYSFDPNPSGSVTAYNWNYGDYVTCPATGCVGTGATSTYAAYSLPTSYYPSLTVTNAAGGISAANFVEVINVVRGYAPRSIFAISGTSGAAPYQVTTDATQSFDYDGTIASYSWNWGDGSAVSMGLTSLHSYTAAGSYMASLTVTDNDGNYNLSSQVVTVTPTATYVAQDDVGGPTPSKQLLMNACAQKSGAACDQLSQIYAANGDSTTAGNLKVMACSYGFTADCSGKW